MDKFIIEGGVSLNGEIRVKSAKNAVLPILAASLLAVEGESVVKNIPATEDIAIMLKLLASLGARVRYETDGSVILDASNLSGYRADYDLVRRMRASFLVMGPVMARMGRAEVSLPGGCAIGARPVDQHIKGFEKLGVTFEEREGYFIGTVGEITGNRVFFDRPTHTGTENIMMAAVLAKGRTEIINAACDPEVSDLAGYLNKMGAYIKGAGTPHIVIEGVESLTGAEWTPIGDRLEAGTYLYAALATSGNVKVTGFNPEHIGIVLSKIKEMGADLVIEEDSVKLGMFGRAGAVDNVTMPYPGFPTDLQPMAMAVATIATGTSQMRETVFETRFIHTMEFARLGADITVLGDRATIHGVQSLSGADIMASDIRAGAGLVIAALASYGTSRIHRVYHIDRGYESLERGFASLGANIIRV